MPKTHRISKIFLNIFINLIHFIYFSDNPPASVRLLVDSGVAIALSRRTFWGYRLCVVCVVPATAALLSVFIGRQQSTQLDTANTAHNCTQVFGILI